MATPPKSYLIRIYDNRAKSLFSFYNHFVDYHIITVFNIQVTFKDITNGKNNPNKEIPSDKFPLTLHTMGQYCKKIKGKIYYFGKNKKQAHERYLKYAAFLLSGTPKINNDSLSIKELCNLYLEHQESRVEIGEVQSRHYFDQISLLKDFVKFVGKTRLVTDISTIELQNYRLKLIKGGKSPNTINNRISAVKSMYNWAMNNEIIENFT